MENNKTIFSILSLGIMVFLFTACTPKALPPKEYLDWYHSAENGLTQTKSINDIQVAMMYLSDNYLALKNTDATQQSDKETIEQEAGHFRDLIYFKLKVAVNDNKKDLLNHKLTAQNEYNKRIQYYSFMLKDDLKLIIGEDTLACALHNFERSYGLSPYANFLVAFEKKENIKDDLHILFNERVFNSGPMRFTFNEKAIRKIPHLKF